MLKRKRCLGIVLALVSAFAALGALACGTDEKIVEVEKEVVVEKVVVREVPVEKVVEKVVVREVPVEKVVIKEVVVPPAVVEVEVHPGKLTVLSGNFGSERFDGFYGGEASDYQSLIHAFLREHDTDKDGKQYAAPGILTAWELAGDGRIWTLDVRKGVKFHDGSDLTGADVLWTMRHVLGPQAADKSPSPGVVSWSKNTVSIEQTGPYQIRYTTLEPNTGWLGYSLKLTGGWSGISAVLPKRANLFDEEAASAYRRSPIGAGMAKLVNQVSGSSMLFERFDDYYYHPENGLPTDKRLKFSQLELFLVPEEATRVAAIVAGDADIGLVSLGAKAQLARGGARLVFGGEAGFLYFHFINCWKLPDLPCNDQRVRQAISYAIDKELMRDRLFGGSEAFVVKGCCVVTPSTHGYWPPLDPFPYDPGKARQLMADAGYPGGEGFPKVIINVSGSGHVPQVPESAQLVGDFLKKELGLDVEVRAMDSAARNKAVASGEIDGQINVSVSETRFDATGYNRYVFDVERLHNDPELAALMYDALAITDPVGRESALMRAYADLRDSAYRITLGYSNSPFGVSSRVLEYRPRALASYASGMHTVILK